MPLALSNLSKPIQQDEQIPISMASYSSGDTPIPQILPKSLLLNFDRPSSTTQHITEAISSLLKIPFTVHPIPVLGSQYDIVSRSPHLPLPLVTSPTRNFPQPVPPPILPLSPFSVENIPFPKSPPRYSIPVSNNLYTPKKGNSSDLITQTGSKTSELNCSKTHLRQSYGENMSTNSSMLRYPDCTLKSRETDFEDNLSSYEVISMERSTDSNCESLESLAEPNQFCLSRNENVNLPSIYEQHSQDNVRKEIMNYDRTVVIQEFQKELLVNNNDKDDYVALGCELFIKQLQSVLCTAATDKDIKNDVFNIAKWFVVIESLYHDLIYHKNKITLDRIGKYAHIFNVILDYFNFCKEQHIPLYTIEIDQYSNKVEAIITYLNMNFQKEDNEVLTDIKDAATLLQTHRARVKKFLLRYHFNIEPTVQCETNPADITEECKQKKIDKYCDYIDKLFKAKDGKLCFLIFSKVTENSMNFILKTLENNLMFPHVDEALEKCKILIETKIEIERVKETIEILCNKQSRSQEDINELQLIKEKLKSWKSTVKLRKEIEDTLCCHSKTQSCTPESSAPSSNDSDFTTLGLTDKYNMGNLSSSQLSPYYLAEDSFSSDSDLVKTFLEKEKMFSSSNNEEWGVNLNCVISTNQSYLTQPNAITQTLNKLGSKILKRDIVDDSINSVLPECNSNDKKTNPVVLNVRDPRFKTINQFKESQSTKTEILYRLVKYPVKIPYVRYKSILDMSKDKVLMDPRLIKDNARLTKEIAKTKYLLKEKSKNKNSNPACPSKNKRTSDVKNASPKSKDTLNTRDPRINKNRDIDNTIDTSNTFTEEENPTSTLERKGTNLLDELLSNEDCKSAWSRIPFNTRTNNYLDGTNAVPNKCQINLNPSIAISTLDLDNYSSHTLKNKNCPKNEEFSAKVSKDPIQPDKKNTENPRFLEESAKITPELSLQSIQKTSQSNICHEIKSETPLSFFPNKDNSKKSSQVGSCEEITDRTPSSPCRIKSKESTKNKDSEVSPKTGSILKSNIICHKDLKDTIKVIIADETFNKVELDMKKEILNNPKTQEKNKTQTKNDSKDKIVKKIIKTQSNMSQEKIKVSTKSVAHKPNLQCINIFEQTKKMQKVDTKNDLFIATNTTEFKKTLIKDKGQSIGNFESTDKIKSNMDMMGKSDFKLKQKENLTNVRTNLLDLPFLKPFKSDPKLFKCSVNISMPKSFFAKTSCSSEESRSSKSLKRTKGSEIKNENVLSKEQVNKHNLVKRKKQSNSTKQKKTCTEATKKTKLVKIIQQNNSGSSHDQNQNHNFIKEVIDNDVKPDDKMKSTLNKIKMETTISCEETRIEYAKNKIELDRTKNRSDAIQTEPVDNSLVKVETACSNDMGEIHKYSHQIKLFNKHDLEILIKSKDIALNNCNYNDKNALICSKIESFKRRSDKSGQIESSKESVPVSPQNFVNRDLKSSPTSRSSGAKAPISFYKDENKSPLCPNKSGEKPPKLTRKSTKKSPQCSKKNRSKINISQSDNYSVGKSPQSSEENESLQSSGSKDTDNALADAIHLASKKCYQDNSNFPHTESLVNSSTNKELSQLKSGYTSELNNTTGPEIESDRMACENINIKSVFERMKRKVKKMDSDPCFMIETSKAITTTHESQIPKVIRTTRHSLDSCAKLNDIKLPIKINLRRCSDDTWMNLQSKSEHPKKYEANFAIQKPVTFIPSSDEQCHIEQGNNLTLTKKIKPLVFKWNETEKINSKEETILSQDNTRVALSELNQASCDSVDDSSENENQTEDYPDPNNLFANKRKRIENESYLEDNNTENGERATSNQSSLSEESIIMVESNNIELDLNSSRNILNHKHRKRKKFSIENFTLVKHDL